MSKHLIPITIISGYLGSGKTTLIQHILKCKENRRIGIIVNDFSELNIDEKLIRNSIHFTEEDKLISLADGLISGSLSERLNDAIYNLANSKEVDLILVESSGIARPDKIAQAVSDGETSKGKLLSENTVLDTTVTIVDGYRLLQQFTPENGRFNDTFNDSNILIINQIEFCDVLLFNKADLLTKEEKTYLLNMVKKLQPDAKFIESTFSQVPLSSVIETKLYNKEKTIRQFNNVDIENEANTYGITSFVYRRRAPFHPERFDEWLNQWPKEVSRCKGVIWVVTQPNTVIKISQAGRAMDIIPSGYWIASLKKWEVEKLFTIREGLKEIWDQEYGDRMIELVFIGRGMNKEKIVEELDNCLVQKGESIVALTDPFLVTEES